MVSRVVISVGFFVGKDFDSEKRTSVLEKGNLYFFVHKELVLLWKTC